jgi:carbon-monoxide dehydrogenase large subunit
MAATEGVQLNTGLNVQAKTEADAVLQRRKYIGMSVLRTEDPMFLTGRGHYTDDIHLAGMVHAAFLRSPHPHARIKSIDKEAALAIDGVHAVYTQEDFDPILAPFVTTNPRPGVKTVTRPIMDSVARYVGQPVALVLADSRYLAEDGVDALQVDWEILEPVMDPERALEPDAPLLRDDLDGTNNFAHIEFQRGDVDELFAKADKVFSKRFHHGRYMAAPLETRGVIADWDVHSGELTVWTSTQIPHLIRTYTAGPLGIPESKVRVIADHVGGGFGMKAHVFDEEALIPAASKLFGRPVKWIEDRYENLAASLHSKEIVMYLDIAMDADNNFLAFRGRYIGVGGAWPAHPWTSLIDTLPAASLLPSIYDIQAVRTEIDNPLTNRCPSGAYRGVGWTPGHSARETMIDDIAREIGVDPVQLRLQNCIPDEPFVTVTGMKYDGGSYGASIRKVVEMIDYDNLRKKQEELRKEGRYIGIGFSPYVEPTAWGSEVAKANGFAAEFFDAASVTVEPDGSITVTTGCHNHGQAHYTTLAQVAADTLGVPFESIRVIENDSTQAVYGTGTYASRTAVIAGGAIMRAGTEVRDKIIRLAAHAMEVSPEDVELADGVATVKGVPDKKMTMAELGFMSYYGGSNRVPDTEPALTATRSYDPPETYSNGTIVAIIELDVETGKVDLQHVACCEDCGTMLNPMVVDGQMIGAISHGIGGSMYEDLTYDENGQFLASSLMDYLYPSTTEVPDMDISHIETPSVVTEGGIKGMGESGNIAAGAACLNAIADALTPFGNVQITKTPIGPSEILDLIREARGGSGNGAGPAGGTAPAGTDTRLGQLSQDA